MRKKDLEERIESLQNYFERNMEFLADSIRKDHVIPICKKYNLSFYSGNGTFAFFLGEDIIGSRSDAKRFLGVSMSLVFDLLEVPVNRVMSVGDYVSDVKPGKDY
jgi:hypothetical protein